VAQNFTANVLLAAGCVPSMTLSPEEVGPFVAGANALLVNLGTFDRERREAVETAVAMAVAENVPWVLDPVLIDRNPARAAFARDLVRRGPRVVRLNHAEFTALSDDAPAPDALAAYARAQRVVLALSGATDLVADGERLVTVRNGDPLMAKVTAMGCAGSALVAACLAVEHDATQGAAAALAMLGVAGELAAAEAEGPASFAVAIVDALYRLDAPAFLRHAKVT
jgi:hydroxyethylthiazole kinase